jgi:hypothetical protein
MGAVGAAQPLNGAVRAPARLEQEVDPPLLVLRIEAGMVGPPVPPASEKTRMRLPAMNALASATIADGGRD